ncbi:Receptor-like protein 12 [Cocos nucifera]|uniref:Receptor-like protein 12 n=1 Tax=Cocos nucifera TaxID=13894 RepID=A0A8K0IGH2_COCNU|nr:Receptor-like protein 12 [Cocos nucifera]
MSSTNTSIPHVYVIWVALLLFIGSWQPCLCFSGNSSRSGSCMERERKALLSVQKGIYDARKWLSWNGTNNNLSGPLPSQIGELRSLVYLNLAFNSLNGSIPTSLGKLSALSVLYLSSNSLSGALTEAHFANLTGLFTLDLSYNSLMMNVSQDWLPPFKAGEIRMGSCQLGPKFPPWLRNQTNLSTLDISNAEILENFPEWFLDMCPFGDHFNVSHNQIKGKLPSSLDCLYNKNFSAEIRGSMDLSNNLFSGPIPPNLAGSVFLPNILLLADNRISGGIPSAFCKANQLEILNLANNDLSGVLPDCWNNSLTVIDFSDNKLSGGIPSSMGSLSQLCSLHLRNNNLSGKIPRSLKQCKRLMTLDLGNNKLSGGIPEWIGESLSSLKVLRLRSNMLDGNIPTNLSLLASLQVLDLADNNLSGTLPPSFGNFKAMIVIQNESKSVLSEDVASYYTENLLITMKGLDLTFTTVLSLVTSLDLSDNNISGEIPEKLTKLYGLHFLNLSGNHLTGRIPKNIGAMGQLESLDLSMNNLSSTIPTSISNLNFLAHLNLSYNNLSGRIPSGSQLQTFINDPSIYIGNRYLCGQPLPEKCPGDEPARGPTVHGREEKQDENENDSEMIWFYVSLSPGFVVGFWGFLGAVMLKKSSRYAYIRFIDRLCDWIHMVTTTNSAKPKSKRNRGCM